MSSTCCHQNELEALIGVDDNEGIVRCLEILVKQNAATEAEKMLLGVLMMMPPIADCARACTIFDGLMDGPKSLEAAAWSAYRYGVLQPDENKNFEPVLNAHSTSSIAHHMLSLVAIADNNQKSFVLENRASREISLFPCNILIALDGDSELRDSERRDLCLIMMDLLVSRSAEADSPVHTVEGLLQRKWENLIAGVRVTTEYWKILESSHQLASL